MLPENQVIQMLWIGDRLSTMERLSIRSFQANGHTVHLYVYGDVQNIPEGTVVKDGNEIISGTRITDFWCPAMFADLFRHALLINGGWYADTDFVCLRPLDFPQPYVFYRDQQLTTATTALCKTPKDAPVMKFWFDTVNKMTKDQLQSAEYQAVGPTMTRKTLMPNSAYAYGRRNNDYRRFEHLQQYFKPGMTFDPVNYQKAGLLVDPNRSE